MRYIVYTIVILISFGFRIIAMGGSMKGYEAAMEMYRKQCEKEFDLKHLKLAKDEQGVVADWSNPAE